MICDIYWWGDGDGMVSMVVDLLMVVLCNLFCLEYGNWELVVNFDNVWFWWDMCRYKGWWKVDWRGCGGLGEGWLGRMGGGL